MRIGQISKAFRANHGREMGVGALVGYFKNKDDASIAVYGKGEWGGNGAVTEVTVILAETGLYHEVKEDAGFKLDQNVEQGRHAMAEQLKKKLSHEDLEFLVKNKDLFTELKK